MSLTVNEQKWLENQFNEIKASIKDGRKEVTALTNDHNQRLPIIERGLADVRSTLYEPVTGLQHQVTIIAERQTECQIRMAPGNVSERRGTVIALGALLVSLFMMVLMIAQIGGCTPMPPKKTTDKQMSNLSEVDTLDEYAELKKEITALVKGIGKDARLELTGDRTYVIESDGTMFMQHADQRRAVNTWRAEEWGYFREDMAHNRLRERLEAL